MRKRKHDESSDEDLYIMTKAKMKRVHVVRSSDVEVDQHANIPFDKKNDSLRINAPDDLKDGKTYKDATVGTKKTIVIKEKK